MARDRHVPQAQRVQAAGRGGVGVAPRELRGQPVILEHAEHAGVGHAAPEVVVAEADEQRGLPDGQVPGSGAQPLAQRSEGR